MILAGTCSWTEKTLLKSGGFYPDRVSSAEDRLRYYAGLFSTVEVDATYYALPSQRVVRLWNDRSPDGFVFHIKAYGALTGHGVDPKTLPADLREALPERERGLGRTYVKDPAVRDEINRRFRDALLPLARAGKLGLIVYQFPPWFRFSPANLAEIAACRDAMQGMRIAVEFRHGSWLAANTAETVFSFLREQGITYVTADEPQYGTLATVPFFAEVTTDTAYFRFHGRNRENWLRRGIETSLRYDYLYSEEELQSFVPQLRGCQGSAKVVYAMFNNCHGASAVKNAMRMAEIIDGGKQRL